MPNLRIVRRYKNEPVLILGCGNKLNSDIHHHSNCFTIDPDAAQNPSVVGRFGIDPIRFLPPSCFDMILFEGFLLNAFYDKTRRIVTDDICTISSLIYLLKNEGVICISSGSRLCFVVAFKREGKLESVDGQTFCIDNDYICFAQLCNKVLGFKAEE